MLLSDNKINELMLIKKIFISSSFFHYVVETHTTKPNVKPHKRSTTYVVSATKQSCGLLMARSEPSMVYFVVEPLAARLYKAILPNA